MSAKKIGAAVAAVVIAAVAVVLLLGGGDGAQAEDTDGAFITEMVPHHEMAIEMARVAQQRAEHPEIKQLAEDIIAAQQGEIQDLEDMHQRLYGEPVSDGEHGTLGLDAQMMGMSMDVSMLETAKPFDRAFIDKMIPHHQGAIQMARVELAEGQDQEAEDLATAIVNAQSREIEEMNSWREKWYGAPSPAGGVPSAEETTLPSHDSMGH